MWDCYPCSFARCRRVGQVDPAEADEADTRGGRLSAGGALPVRGGGAQ